MINVGIRTFRRVCSAGDNSGSLAVYTTELEDMSKSFFPPDESVGTSYSHKMDHKSKYRIHDNVRQNVHGSFHLKWI